MRGSAFRLFVLTALASTALGASANAVTSVSSGAYGLGATLDVLNFVGVGVGPIDSVSGSAPGAYSNSATVLSVADTLGLGIVANQGLNTGVIVSSASSPFPGSPTGTATSTVNNLGTSLSSLLGSSFLSLGATTVTSTSSVNGVGSLSAFGSTQIVGLTVTGSALNGLTINGSLYGNPAPNTVLFSLAGLTILLNEQIPSGNGTTSDGIQTNAIDIIFNNFALTGGLTASLLSGNIIVAHSQADIFGPATLPVPEPATWLELLGGLAIVGSVARRRVPKTA